MSIFGVEWFYPAWLLGLLLAPVVFYLILTFLGQKRTTFPSIRFWSSSASSPSSDRSSPHWKHIISALCFTLFFCGLLLGLASPYHTETNSIPMGNLHIYLDLSASMNAKGASGPRFQTALQKIENLTKKSGKQARWKATTIGPPWKTREGSPEEILNFLRQFSPSHRGMNIWRQFSSLQEETESNASWKSVLITDQNDTATTPESNDESPSSPANPNSNSSYENSEQLRTKTEIISVGDPQPNYGFVSTHSLMEKDHLVVIAEVFFVGESPKTVPIRLNFNTDEIIKTKTIELPPGKKRPVRFKLSPDQLTKTSPVRIRIPDSPEDALALDNQIVLVPRQNYPVFLDPHGKLPEYFLRWLDTEQTQISQRPRNHSFPPSIRLFYGESPPDKNPKNGPKIIITPGINNQSTKSRKRVDITNAWVQSHPLTRNVSLQGIKFFDVTPVRIESTPEKEAIPIIQSDQGALATYQESPAKLRFYFDPFQKKNTGGTNWSVHPDNPSFVIFWKNIFSYFSPWNIKTNTPLVSWKTGELPVRNDAPNRLLEKLKKRSSNVGYNTVNRENTTIQFPRNLLSISETDLRPPKSEDSLKTVLEHSQQTKTIHSYRAYVIWPAFLLFLAGYAFSFGFVRA